MVDIFKKFVLNFLKICKGAAMELVKKLNNIFEKEQKWKLLILFIMILIGTFAELLGVSAVLPLIQVAMKPAVVEENILVSRIADIFH